MSGLVEKAKWSIHWTIDKFTDPYNDIAKRLRSGASLDVLRQLVAHTSQEDILGNCLLNIGISELWDIFIGNSINIFDNDYAQIGVGNSNTAALANQTDLLGSSTEYVEMDVSYPLVSSQTVIFRSTFGSSEANFSWQEFVIKQSTSGICLNRKVYNNGAKSSGMTWVVTVNIALS